MSKPNGRSEDYGDLDTIDAEDKPRSGFAPDELEDAVEVARRGRAIEAQGVPYVLDGIVPAFGMLGFIVAYAKVGKTTFGQALAAHMSMGRAFLQRSTTRCRVLVLAPEDPPEYTAWLARHLDVEPGRMTFRCKPLILDAGGLSNVCATVDQGGWPDGQTSASLQESRRGQKTTLYQRLEAQ